MGYEFNQWCTVHHCFQWYTTLVVCWNFSFCPWSHEVSVFFLLYRILNDNLSFQWYIRGAILLVVAPVMGGFSLRNSAGGESGSVRTFCFASKSSTGPGSEFAPVEDHLGTLQTWFFTSSEYSINQGSKFGDGGSSDFSLEFYYSSSRERFIYAGALSSSGLDDCGLSDIFQRQFLFQMVGIQQESWQCVCVCVKNTDAVYNANVVII